MAQWEKLCRALDGALIRPGEPGYEQSRRWFLGTLDERLPQAVARCAHAEDVAAAIAFAREHGLAFALRSGGSSTAGHSATSGLLIDLGAMQSVSVDPQAATVTVGAGVLSGRLNRALAPAGRVVPLVWMPSVGVAGSALGGGFGPLSRRHGLTCDHLVAAEVVLADSRIVVVGRDSFADLWWGLRGAGGGHLAAVTRLTFRTHQAMPATDFTLRWPVEHAAGVADAWQRWAPAARLEVNAELVVQAPASGPPEVVLFGLATGDPAAARRDLEQFSATTGAEPLSAVLRRLPAREVTTGYGFAGRPVAEAMTGGRPDDIEPGFRVIKSEFFAKPVPRPALADLIAFLLRDRTPGEHRELEFVAWPGGLHGVTVGETAFAHRDAAFMVNHVAVRMGTRAEKVAAKRWATTSKAILSPYGTGHVYQNYPDPDLADWRTAYYGPHAIRLRQLSQACDPDGVFASAQPLR